MCCGESARHVRKIQLILGLLNVAREPLMMNAPGLRFHALTGDRKGQYAVSVSGNWRIVFEFEGQDATNVELVDYHWRRKGRAVMNMHNPPHPGEILRELYLKPLDLTITAAAEGLGVTRKALSELVNGRTDISRDMAIRLAKALPNTDIRLWLDLQLQYDTWQAEQRAATIKVTPFAARPVLP